MNTKIWAMTAIAVCIGLLLTSLSSALVQSSATVSSSGVIQQTPTPTPTGTYSYNISVSGSNYQMTNGTTGQLHYQSTNAAQVVNDAIGNLTQGGSILFKAGTYILTGSIIGHNKNNITLAFEEDATLFVSNNMNAPAILLTSCDNWLISNVSINGNRANQNLGGGTGIHGIFIASSQNTVVDRANIASVVQFGYVSGDSTNCGITNSIFTDCAWNGIELGSAYAMGTGNYAINNTVSHSGDVGISIFDHYCIVQGNNIHNMDGTDGFNNAKWGIAIEDGDGHNLITQNTVTTALNGVVVGYGTYNNVTYNIFQNVAWANIHVATDFNRILHNSMKELLVTDGADDSEIAFNTWVGNTSFPVNLQYGTFDSTNYWHDNGLVGEPLGLYPFGYS